MKQTNANLLKIAAVGLVALSGIGGAILWQKYRKPKQNNQKLSWTKSLAKLCPEIKIKGVYKHFRGDLYIVEDVALHSETGERMVIYRALYEDGKLYARPYKLFIDQVDHQKYPNIKQKYRFELQGIESVNNK